MMLNVRRTSVCSHLLYTALAFVLAPAMAYAAAEPKPAGPTAAPSPGIDEKTTIVFDKKELTIPDFKAEGLILDIGGGGEGIIGRIKANQVVAIDLSKQELVEAPPGPLKIVMDATDLKFLDESFNTATIFFTLMYMDDENKAKTLTEVHRVLAPKGHVLLWDVLVDRPPDPAKTAALFWLEFRLPKGKIVNTGYGAKLSRVIHDEKYYIDLAEAAGFRVTRRRVDGWTMFLDLEKR